LAAWQLGFFVPAGWVLLGYCSPLGYRFFWPTPVEIQMHSTFFVLNTFAATFPFFLFTALLVTGARVVKGGIRQAAALTLGGLLLVLLLAVVLISMA